MTRSEFLEQAMAVCGRVTDFRVPLDQLQEEIATFLALEMPDGWRAEARSAIGTTMEVRNPGHLADKRGPAR